MQLIDPELGKRLSELIRRSAESSAAAAQALGKIGWTVPMDFSPREAVEVVELGSEEAVDQFFEEYYLEDSGRRLQSLVARLRGSGLLQRWEPLIRESHDAFEQVGHLVVVPSLLTVLEGAVAHLGNSLQRKADIVGVVRDTRNSFRKGSFTYAMWDSVHSFIDTVFESKRFGEDDRPRLNRHWILHGRDAPEWKKADALRLFHALGTLVDLGRQVEGVDASHARHITPARASAAPK